MGEPISLMQWITLAIAVLGAGLGIFNTWRGWDRDRVKLRVIPLFAKPVLVGNDRGYFTSPDVMPDAERLCIQVINVGQTAATLSQVGFLYKDDDGHGVVLSPQLDRDEKLPLRLEPRTSVTAYLDPTAHRESRFSRVRCAFAKTECGRRMKGTSPALKYAVMLAARR